MHSWPNIVVCTRQNHSLLEVFVTFILFKCRKPKLQSRLRMDTLALPSGLSQSNHRLTPEHVDEQCDVIGELRKVRLLHVSLLGTSCQAPC